MGNIKGRHWKYAWWTGEVVCHS